MFFPVMAVSKFFALHKQFKRSQHRATLLGQQGFMILDENFKQA
jgi:hypothetical protein